jgi:hypothetical protein
MFLLQIFLKSPLGFWQAFFFCELFLKVHCFQFFPQFKQLMKIVIGSSAERV